MPLAAVEMLWLLPLWDTLVWSDFVPSAMLHVFSLTLLWS